MEKLGQLVKYVVTPNTRFFGGVKYEGKDIDLCDDREEYENTKTKEIDSKIHIRQIIQNGVLITDIESEYRMFTGKKVKSIEHQEAEIDEGQLLIYAQGRGFVIPEYKMSTIDEAKNLYELLRGNIEDEIKGNEE